MTERLTVGVVFGGRSVEHDVSVITGIQVINAMNSDHYEAVPIYIARSGDWYTGDALRDIRSYGGVDIGMIGARPTAILPIRSARGLVTPPISRLFQTSRLVNLNVVIPAIHGTHGEDGTLQGLLELADIPYVGFGVLASAIGMNKLLTKQVLRQHDLPVLSSVNVRIDDWRADPGRCIASVGDAGLTFPVFVKPCNLGSSIGIARVASPSTLTEALEIAFAYDDLVLIEEAAEGFVEVNCAVIRSRKEVLISASEQPVSWEEFLTYEDKYMRAGPELGMHGAERIIPAPIPDQMIQAVEEMATRAVEAIGGYGLARVDMFVNVKSRQVYINELNTTPGSFSFYLWKPVGIEPEQLIDKLIAIAFENHEAKQRRLFTFESGLLERASASGTKLGVKGVSASGPG